MDLDSKTLHKLMILYMMNKVSFLLNFSQLSTFFLDYGYMNFFTFQQLISELSDNKLIEIQKSKTTQKYKITDNGISTLSYFQNQIPKNSVDDINEYISKNKIKMRSESSITSSISDQAKNNFLVSLEIEEDKDTAFSINMLAPDIDTATKICENWKAKAQNIYNYFIEQLI